jgi:hypothetical protein
LRTLVFSLPNGTGEVSAAARWKWVKSLARRANQHVSPLLGEREME